MKRVSFTEHPAAVGETYGEHFRVATGFGAAMLLGGAACMVHAVLPFLFTSTGSATIARLHDCMVVSRARARQNAAVQPDANEPARELIAS